MDENSLDPNLVRAFFKSASKRKAPDRERNEGDNALNCEVGAEISKKSRTMSGISLLRRLINIFGYDETLGATGFQRGSLFTGAEAVQRASIIGEAEGISQIEATQLERILSQLLLDF